MKEVVIGQLTQIIVNGKMYEYLGKIRGRRLAMITNLGTEEVEIKFLNKGKKK